MAIDLEKLKEDDVFQIFFDDLKPEKQQELVDRLGLDVNDETLRKEPIVYICFENSDEEAEFEEDEEKEEPKKE